MAEPERRERIQALHDRLAATAELPIEPAASRWLGEAEAVAADAVALAESDASDEALERRLEQVRDLLSHVEETGHPEADEHVVDARQIAEQLAE